MPGQVEEAGPRVSVCGPVKGTGPKESRRRLLDAAQRRDLVQEGVIDVDHVQCLARGEPGARLRQFPGTVRAPAQLGHRLRQAWPYPRHAVAPDAAPPWTAIEPPAFSAAKMPSSGKPYSSGCWPSIAVTTDENDRGGLSTTTGA